MQFNNSPASCIVDNTFSQQNAPVKGYWQLSIGNKECPNYKTFNDSALLNYLSKANLKFGISTGSPKDSISSKNNKKLFEPQSIEASSTKAFHRVGPRAPANRP